MFKRIALALTFLTAFSVAGFTMTPSAEAWRYWGRPYNSYYYGAPRAYYYGYNPYYYPRYRTYYYGPRVVVTPPYTAYYYGPGYYYR
jgi:hypothetical protein